MDNKQLDKLELSEENIEEVAGGGFKIIGVMSQVELNALIVRS